MEKRKLNDAEKFSDILKKIDLPGYINFGSFKLELEKGVESIIQYNKNGKNLLEEKHDYTVKLLNGQLQISIQLYENSNNHYRLFCFTKFKSKTGMVFSVNLTTEKETENIIFLIQKIKFAEQYKGSEELAQSHRRQKQNVMCEILKNCGLDVTENNDVILGMFNPTKKLLENTSGEKFINDFLVVSILKGHFQGNKGYQIEILPKFNKSDEIFNYKEREINNLPARIIENKSKREIASGIRYKILERDKFKCLKCGRNVSDGISLQVDHKKPFSLGGLTEWNNLQTLCNECNIGKSNKYIDK